MNPFYLMTVLYLSLAALVALDVSLINFDLLPMFSGIRWLRIHFITLGGLTGFLFGILPILVAAKNKLPRPRVRLDIWVLLNAGILSLLVGIPMINQVVINVGGTLVFTATTLLAIQLWQLSPSKAVEEAKTHMSGRWFYITGLIYLLLGILIGTGLWQPWLRWFYMEVPIEVHIHANNWGFMSLIFAGLLIDFYPRFSGHQLAWSGSVNKIFWMMSLGALGLVLGPWFKSNYFAVPGLIAHLSATIWLLANIIKPVMTSGKGWHVGLLHIITSYVWILAPVMVAPLIIFQVPGFPGAGIEQNAPQALIYGWVLQFSFAFIPMFMRSVLNQDDEQVQLGGSWISLIAVHAGGILLWSGIFFTESRPLLHGFAYGLWFIAMLPILLELWRIVENKLADDPAYSLAEAGD